MVARYRRQALYVLLLVAAAVAAGWQMAGDGVAWPSLPTWLFAIASFLFVWQFGIQAPAMGLVSLERIPQFGFLLVFEPTVAAALNAAAALIWPFLNQRYRQGSFKVATVRALHNAAMTALMLLAAGAAYRACGGSHPLRELGLPVLPALAVAVGSSRVDLQACKLEYSIVSPK